MIKEDSNSNAIDFTKVITTIDDLSKYAQGQVVQLPAFAEGQPFTARIKRPSMLALIKSGKIPNSLLKVATALFNGDPVAGGSKSTKEDEVAMSNLFQVLDVVAEACLVEPTMEDLKKAGIQLSDDQYMFIFNYTQRGVKALESFR